MQLRTIQFALAVCVSFMPTRHRHCAEIIQELSFEQALNIHFSATSIEMVRGVLATSHTFLKDPLTEKDIWQAYRRVYKDQPFYSHHKGGSR